MIYTHKYEIEFNGTKLEGEMNFNSGKPCFKTDTAVEMKKEEATALSELFNALVKINKNCGCITKIEINEQ